MVKKYIFILEQTKIENQLKSLFTVKNYKTIKFILLPENQKFNTGIFVLPEQVSSHN